MERKPSIGRIVIYKPADPADEAIPAVIQNVAADGSVRLHTFTKDGYSIWENVPQGDDAGQWDWPRQIEGPERPEQPIAKPPKPEINPLKK